MKHVLLTLLVFGMGILWKATRYVKSQVKWYCKPVSYRYTLLFNFT